jgi:hypothetical protein
MRLKMNSDEITRQGRDDVCAEVTRCTAKEAVTREARRIDVPENTELLISPSDPEFADSFARVQINSYSDLQLLGFVPRKLAEDKVRQALASDDAEVYKLASSMPHLSTRDCDCECHDKNGSKSRGSSLRPIYNSIRKSHNPALAGLLSDHFGTSISWDSPLAGIVRKWSLYVRLKPEVLALRLEDITINRNATLTVAASSKSLMAHNIWIHRTGRLVQSGSYLKIWANSINYFREFPQLALVEAARKLAPPWLVTE